METAKIIFLGIWLISVETIAYLYLSLFRRLPGQTAVAVSVFAAYTIYNWTWWAGVVLSFAAGFVIVKSWSVQPVLWVGLAITEIIPVGLLTIFLILVARLKQAAGRINAQRQPE